MLGMKVRFSKLKNRTYIWHRKIVMCIYIYIYINTNILLAVST